jgi:hypothetical protein
VKRKHQTVDEIQELMTLSNFVSSVSKQGHFHQNIHNPDEFLPGEEFMPEGFGAITKGKRKQSKHTNLVSNQSVKIQNNLTLDIDLKLMSVEKVKVIQVACSNCHSLALANTGAIYGWGENDCQQLGFRTSKNKAGVSHAPVPRKVEGLK